MNTARFYNFGENNTNLLRTAVLIHDLPHCFRWSDEHQKLKTIPDHASLCAQELELVLESINISNESKEVLVAMVAYHMSRWGKYEDHKDFFKNYKHLKDHPLVRATQDVDYYSSRRIVAVNYEL